MWMSASDRERAGQMLDELTRGERAAVMASELSFASWLRRVAYSIYDNVKSILTPVYGFFRMLYG